MAIEFTESVSGPDKKGKIIDFSGALAEINRVLDAQKAEKKEEKKDSELEEARKIIEERGDESEIKKLNQELAIILVNMRGDEGAKELDLRGLKSLDAKTAAELTKFPGNRINLYGVTNLDEDTLWELAKFHGKIECRDILSKKILEVGLKKLEEQEKKDIAGVVKEIRNDIKEKLNRISK